MSSIFSPLLLSRPQFPSVRSSHIVGIAPHSLDHPVEDSRGDEGDGVMVILLITRAVILIPVYLAMKVMTVKMLMVMMMIPVHQA